MTFERGQQVLGYRVDSLLSAEGAAVALGRSTTQPALLVRLPAELPGVHIAAREADWLAASGRVVHGHPSLGAPVALGAVDSAACAVYPLMGAAWPSFAALPSAGGRSVTTLLAEFEGIVLALATLHDQGLFHGAIRRELVSLQAGQLRLAGAGLADLAAELGGPRLVRDLVPQDFRPPELRGLNPPVAASWGDVFAVGVLMSELLAGRAARGEEQVTPRALGAEVPEWLEQEIAACVSERISDRPRDLREWWRKLQGLAGQGDGPRVQRSSAAQGLAPPAAQVSGVAVVADQPPPDPVVPEVDFEAPALAGKLPHMPLVPAAPRIAPARAVPAASSVPGGPLIPAPSALPPAAELPPPSWLAPKPKLAFQAVPHVASAPSDPEAGFTPPPGVVSMVHHGETTLAQGVAPPLGAEPPDAPLSRSLPGRPVYAPAIPQGMQPAPAEHDTLGFNIAAGKLQPRDSEPATSRDADAVAVDEVAPRSVSPLAPSWQQEGASGIAQQADRAQHADTSRQAAMASGPGVAAQERGPSPPPSPNPPTTPSTLDSAAVSAAERRGRLMIGAGVVMAGLLLVVGLGVIFALKAPSPAPTGPPTSPVTGADAGVLPAPSPTNPRGSTGADAGAQTPPAGAGGASSEDAEDAGVTPRLARGASAGDFAFAALSDGAALLPLQSHTPVWGAASAPVTLVVFGDLECKHTRRLFRVLERLKRDFGADLRLAWIHTPLRVHANSLRAAELSAALARSSGSAGFWKTLEEWAHSADAPVDGALEAWAKAAGFDVSAASLAGDADAKRNVAEDRAFGVRFGVRSTPTMYLNGALIEGFHSRGVMHRLVQSELSAVRSLLAQGIGAQDVYLARVKKNLIDVGEAIPPRVCPALLDAPVLGKSDALVTIVQFSDFECRSCAEVQPTLKRLKARYADDLRLVWKHLPLGVHERARPAATLAIEAQLQLGDAGFWKTHDALFAGQRDLSEAGLLNIAKQVGLSATALDAVRADKRRPRIDADIREADRVGARGTPSFFVNGRLLEGALPFAKFQELVNIELKAAKLLVASGTARQDVYDALCGRP